MVELYGLPALAILVVMMVVMYYGYDSSRKGRVWSINKIPALDAIDEALGRAAELGRPAHYTTGLGGLTSATTGPPTIAGYSVLAYVAKKCADLGLTFYVSVRDASQLPVALETTRQAYILAGKEADFKEENVLFFGGQKEAWVAGLMALLQREKVGAHFFIGCSGSEALQTGVAARVAGSFSIGGSAGPGYAQTNAVMMMVSYTYAMIADEVFAAGAYVSKDPLQVGTLVGNDGTKLGIIVLILLGIVLKLIGVV